MNKYSLLRYFPPPSIPPKDDFVNFLKRLDGRGANGRRVTPHVIGVFRYLLRGLFVPSEIFFPPRITSSFRQIRPADILEQRDFFHPWVGFSFGRATSVCRDDSGLRFLRYRRADPTAKPPHACRVCEKAHELLPCL